jgi:hypothetical protein
VQAFNCLLLAQLHIMVAVAVAVDMVALSLQVAPAEVVMVVMEVTHKL